MTNQNTPEQIVAEAMVNAGAPLMGPQVEEAVVAALGAAGLLTTAGVAPQEPSKWEHGVIGGEDLLARLMDTLAYYHCRSVNPKADSPHLGYHAMSEDQREFLRERQREAAEEVLRMWDAGSSIDLPAERRRLVGELRTARIEGTAWRRLLDRAADALAAPVAVDETKLAEVINEALDAWQGEERSEVFVAHAIAEYLRGDRA